METWKLFFIAGCFFIIVACLIGSFGRKPKPDFETELRDSTTEEAICGCLGILWLLLAIITFGVEKF